MCRSHKNRCCKKKVVKQVPDVNIFAFGDSFTDPGNWPYEIPPGPQVPISFDAPIPNGQVLQVRFNGEGANSDGLLYPSFVSQDLGLEMLKGSKVKKVRGKGKFVNFALSGASQTQVAAVVIGGLVPPVPYYGSYQWQIDTFTQLMANSPCASVTKDDIFLYHAVGDNDFRILTFLLPFQVDVPAFVQAQVDLYVNSTVANLTSLYNKGMRRCFLVIYDEDPNTSPYYIKSAIASGDRAGTLAFFTDILLGNPFGNPGLQPALNAYLDANAAALWPGMELVRLNMSSYLNHLINNAPLNGIVLPYGETFPGSDLFNTQAGVGAWPASEPYPTGNVANLYAIDDVHLTQHSNKLVADVVTQWFAPLKTKTVCKKY